MNGTTNIIRETSWPKRDEAHSKNSPAVQYHRIQISPLPPSVTCKELFAMFVRDNIRVERCKVKEGFAIILAHEEECDKITDAFDGAVLFGLVVSVTTEELL